MKKKIIFYSLIISLLGLIGCENEPIVYPVTVETYNNVEFVQGGVKVKGRIDSEGNQRVTVDKYGFCYATTPEPTIYDNVVEKENELQSSTFTGVIKNLSGSTKYYVRAFAENMTGIVYGNDIIITTKPLPVVNTLSVLNINTSSAKVEAEVLKSEEKLTTLGVVFSDVSEEPTIAEANLVEAKAVSGKYTVDLSDLKSNTTYWVRAYAKNIAGESYGEVIEFTTNKAPNVITNTVENINATCATLKGNVSLEEECDIAEIGFCYGTSTNVTIAYGKTVSLGTTIGDISYALTDLTPNTVYYVKAYAKFNTNEIAYGKEVKFRTLALPTITTYEIRVIDKETIEFSGNITSNDYEITERGVCYSTNSDPTISDKIIELGAGVGKFTCEISELALNTTYYVRAYAKYQENIIYGEQQEFTLSLPSVSIFIDNITYSSAECSGIASSGSFKILEEGVCYSKNPNPTIDDNIIKSSSVGTFFDCSLTNLSSNTTYYVRAYVRYAGGVIYGYEKTFTTPKSTMTVYFVDTDRWNAVGVYVWNELGENNNKWPGEKAKIESGMFINGYYVWSYTIDLTVYSNIIFNSYDKYLIYNRVDGLYYQAQTKDLIIDPNKPYFYDGEWYESVNDIP